MESPRLSNHISLLMLSRIGFQLSTDSVTHSKKQMAVSKFSPDQYSMIHPPPKKWTSNAPPFCIPIYCKNSSHPLFECFYSA